jgi:hypothetical protein
VADRLATEFGRDGAVETLVEVVAHGAKVGQDVAECGKRARSAKRDSVVATFGRSANLQHPDHLAEDEDSVTILLEARQELVQQNHLARVHHEAFERLFTRLGLRLGTFEKVRVIGRLLELHGDVEQRDLLVGSAEGRVILQSRPPGQRTQATKARWPRIRSLTRVRMFLYHQVCMLDISTRRIRSLLVGSSLMTSRLSRRSMIDSSLPCKSRILASFSSSEKVNETRSA